MEDLYRNNGKKNNSFYLLSELINENTCKAIFVYHYTIWIWKNALKGNDFRYNWFEETFFNSTFSLYLWASWAIRFDLCWLFSIFILLWHIVPFLFLFFSLNLSISAFVPRLLPILFANKITFSCLSYHFLSLLAN